MTSPGPNEEETDHGRAYARARAPFLGVRAAQRAITSLSHCARALRRRARLFLFSRHTATNFRFRTAIWRV